MKVMEAVVQTISEYKLSCLKLMFSNEVDEVVGIDSIFILFSEIIKLKFLYIMDYGLCLSVHCILYGVS